MSGKGFMDQTSFLSALKGPVITSYHPGGVQSMVISVSLCLVHWSKFQEILHTCNLLTWLSSPMTTAKYAMHFRFLWMMPCFHMMKPMGQNPRQHDDHIHWLFISTSCLTRNTYCLLYFFKTKTKSTFNICGKMHVSACFFYNLIRSYTSDQQCVWPCPCVCVCVCVCVCAVH